jgi:hypothetical protein
LVVTNPIKKGHKTGDFGARILRKSAAWDWLGGKARWGEVSQFVVDHWHEVGDLLPIPSRVGFEQSGDVRQVLQ